MLRLGIAPGKLYRATFICQDGLCCCNMALISFRLFHKNLGNLRDFFGQMVYRPPWQKISRTPMFVIQDSLGFWIPRRRLRIPGTGFQSLSSKLESGSQSLVRFRIAKPRILDSWEKCSRIPYWTSQNFADSLPRGNSLHLGKKKSQFVFYDGL